MLTILKKFTVLYVEDDPNTQAQVAEILGYFFARVLLARHGMEALELFAEHHIDVLITDYDMPVMDGHHLVREIRRTHPQLPAIIMSSYTDTPKLLNAVKLHLIDYVVKPITYEKLKEVLLLCAQTFHREVAITPHFFYDYTRKACRNEAQEIALTAKESALLELMLSHANRLLSQEFIEYNTPDLHATSLKNILYRLRKKLPKGTLINVKEVGFILHITA